MTTGAPPAPARTIFAWAGPASPWPSTNSPSATSLALTTPMNPMCARISSGVQVSIGRKSVPAALNCISNMYFTSGSSRLRTIIGALTRR
ncbi:hypothetical protein [Micromonospora sp. NPDC023644]|uniref:hypothetical protein n=1 Tax=Micromonospora sp. NPDC023644 TaxID=3154321 RepID=UPI0033DD22D2